LAVLVFPDPRLLILDEPTQGMDVAGRRGFWTAIGDDAALGRTIVFATHYLQEADAYAGRIVLISKGQIVADGTAAEVKGLASGRTLHWGWILNLAVWLAIFVAGAAWSLHRDTARV
jgi:ABC-2 type transport system ATP-binding protein